MSVLYTYGEYIVLTPSQFSGYSTIQYAPGDATSVVELGLASAGSVNFSSRLGSRSASVDGSTGNDNLTLGGGNDTVWGNAGNDAIYGGSGDDGLIGDWSDGTSTGDDRLYGGDGSDVLTGGLGNDSLYGGNGNDYFGIVETESGTDAFYGGSGDDAVEIWDAFGGSSRFEINRLVLNSASSVEYFLIDSGDFDVGGTDGADLFDLSYVRGFTWRGSSWDTGVTIDLRLGADLYIGGQGAETVVASDGNDSINLGAGDDRLVLADGQLGGDSVFGGDGWDILYLGNDASPSNAGTISIDGFGSIPLLDFEQLSVGAYTRLTGTDAANRFDFRGFEGFNPNSMIELLAGNDVFFTPNGAAVDGGDGDDWIEVGLGSSTVLGGAGNDTIYGGGTTDWLSGGEGRDTLHGGEGSDRIEIGSPFGEVDVFYGGGGEDAIILANGAVFTNLIFGSRESIERIGTWPEREGLLTEVFGTSGPNMFDFGGLLALDQALVYRFAMKEGDDWIGGTPFALNADGGTGNDTLQGTQGDDTLLGGAGIDYLVGGRGNDWYSIDNAGDRMVETPLNGGIDTVETSLQSFSLGAVFEHLTHTGITTFSGVGNGLANRMTGGGGADTLLGLLGADSLFGGRGADSLDGGAGNDLLNGELGADTHIGGAGDDRYLVENLADVIVELADGGVDTAVVSATSYSLSANVENGIATGAVGIRLAGNGLANQLSGGVGNDTLLGDLGSDLLVGGAGADRLIGGEGSDTLSGLAGRNILEGGVGNDLYIVSSSADDIRESAGAGVDTVQPRILWCVIPDEIEVMDCRMGNTGGEFTGNDQGNVIRLHYASSNIRSGSRVYGLSGDDTLSTYREFSDFNRDSLFGGLGNDTYVLTSNDPYEDESFFERPGEGIDTVVSAFSGGLAAEIEVLRLTGADNVWGGGNDLDNLIFGNSGANGLFGGHGGSDTMTGGDGADTFSASYFMGVDHVTDMTAGVDTIALTQSWFGWMPAGRLAVNSFKNLALGPVDATDRILFNPATGEVLWDPDGSGAAAATLFFVLDNHAVVSANDFAVLSS